MILSKKRLVGSRLVKVTRFYVEEQTVQCKKQQGARGTDRGRMGLMTSKESTRNVT